MVVTEADDVTTGDSTPRARALITATGTAGLASIGAGAIHAAAIGLHAEHADLSRIFVVIAAAQILAGVLAIVRASRPTLALAILVNGVAVGGWAMTRIWGISWIEGLEVAESPQFADTVCALLGLVAVVSAGLALWRGRETGAVALALPGVVVGTLTVAAMMYGATHVHQHGDAESAAGHTHEAAADDGAAHEHSTSSVDGAGTTEAGSNVEDDHDHAHDETATTVAHVHDETESTAVHDHGDDDIDTAGGTVTGGTETAEPASLAWPRPYDPTAPIDLSGVDGVTADQEARASALLAATQRDLPQFADVSALPALGFRSIGDASTGFEHYINYGYIVDDHLLDPNFPESLVYAVDGDQRELVSAMFIASGVAIDDPSIVDYGGALMQWHVHDNLCWAGGDGGPKMVGVTDADGNCPPGSVQAGGDNPMVHVWIAAHECGPFAALEGHGAGQTDPDAGARTDQCAHGAHGDHDAAAGTDGHADHEMAAPAPYDPSMPIDLSGLEGVTPQQQAFAENLVARTVVDLPQWADPAAAEAAGFHSIGDGATGHEHYIQWDWINDDVWLDPDAPESLVYEPQPDGSKLLVSAMYMLPETTALADVPDWGGPLMQWHIHDNLCFTDDPVAPVVAGVTDAQGGCAAPLVKLAEAPMIHVWITPNQCGPFAALEGIGAGTPPEGEDTWCDTVHGGH